jgi:N-acetylglucosamine-6-phosphate deacetylase
LSMTVYGSLLFHESGSFTHIFNITSTLISAEEGCCVKQQMTSISLLLIVKGVYVTGFSFSGADLLEENCCSLVAEDL